MAALLDNVKFNPTAGGTTDWTFSTAVTGYQSPALAGIVNGTKYKYFAVSADLSQWEIGEGAYNTGTGVLPRTTVLYNSSGTGAATGQSGAGTKVSFTNPPLVSIVALAEDLLTIPPTITATTASTFQNGLSAQDVLTINLGSIGSGAQINYAPHTAQTTMTINNAGGPIAITANDATSNPTNSFSPGIYLNTLEGSGVTPVGLPGGANAYGVTITGTGQPTQSSGNVAQVNFVNVSPGPYASTSDSGAMVLNIYGWKAGDTGLQFWTGGAASGGTFATPAQSVNGDALFQIAGIGTMNTGGFEGNPPVRIDARTTESQTSTTQGGALFFDTQTIGTTIEVTRLGIAENILVGAWTKGANTVNSAAGAILAKNGTAPSSAISGAAAFVPINGGWTIPFGNSGAAFLNLGATLPTIQGVLNLVYPRASNQGFSIHPSADTGGGAAISFENASGSQVGTVTTTSTSTLYATSSDRRLKKNIIDQEGAEVSSIIDRLKVVKHEWENGDVGSFIGFIAQDLYEVYPHAVVIGDTTDSKPGDKEFRGWGRADTLLIPLLVREIQSLRSRLDALEKTSVHS